MSIEKHQITVNGLIVDVVRKNIKNIHLGIYPPNGRIRVAAPLRVNDEAVRIFTISRLTWIKRQQAKFQEQERQSESEYVSGESHYYQSHRYLLNVTYQMGVLRGSIKGCPPGRNGTEWNKPGSPRPHFQFFIVEIIVRSNTYVPIDTNDKGSAILRESGAIDNNLLAWNTPTGI